MKPVQSILALMLASVLFVSCFSAGNPEKTAEKFLSAINERKFEEAKSFGTPETVKLVDMLEQLTKVMDNPDAESPVKYEIIRHTTDGETAVVFFRESGSDVEQELKLKKIDGKWMVHLTKEDMALKDPGPGSAEEEEGYWSDEADSNAVASENILIE
jgi:hypothetical protein